MKPVPGGTFWMGAQSDNPNGQNYDADAYYDGPVHQVTLSSYYMGTTEVTQALWQAVMGSNPSHFAGSGHGNYPVEVVSCYDIESFLTALNAATASQRGNKTFALPTEAQWEFAARGGNNSHGYAFSGSNTAANVAWFRDNSDSTTHPVMGKSPNELGLYDMSGNVQEWCADWYGDYGSGPQTNPTGPSSGSYRVLRGGDYYNSIFTCLVFDRNREYPGSRYINVGFRLVLIP